MSPPAIRKIAQKTGNSGANKAAESPNAANYESVLKFAKTKNRNRDLFRASLAAGDLSRVFARN